MEQAEYYNTSADTILLSLITSVKDESKKTVFLVVFRGTDKREVESAITQLALQLCSRKHFHISYAMGKMDQSDPLSHDMLRSTYTR